MWTHNLYLLGYMGSGKSYLGARLAQQLSLDFVDLDARIEAQAGCSITVLFDQYGADHFRQLEADAVRATLQDAPSVVALGGGTPIYHNNMAWLQQHGTTIFLDPPIETLLQRLRQDRAARPLLATQPVETLRSTIEHMLQQRRPIYEQAAIHITTGIDQEQALRLALRF